MEFSKRLEKLYGLILEERRCARTLDLDRMLAAAHAKEELLPLLQNEHRPLGAAERVLVGKIKEENRRNAYLFLSTLNWIRSTMQFFGKKTTPVRYSGAGAMINTSRGGNLLSGRV